MPNGLLQSVSLNKKIVSSNCKSGPSEIREAGFNIKIVNKKDSKLFSRNMIESLESKIKINNKKNILKYNATYLNKLNMILNRANL